MLTLIEGGFFSGGRAKLEELADIRTKEGKRSLMIVPEQETVDTERRMSEILPASSPLFFEVTNFTRFANTVFRALGGLCGRGAGPAESALLMWRTLTELSPILEAAGKSKDISAGSVTRMLGTVNQLRSAALDPDALAEAARTLGDSGEHIRDARLTSKLKDIANIMTLYKKLTEEKFGGADDELITAAEKLSAAPHDYLTDTEIFIDGFTSFTEAQNRVISELLKRCDVTVNLVLPKEAVDAYEFSETRTTHKKIVKLASDLGIDVKLKRIGGIHTEVSPMLCDTASLIWRSSGRLEPEFVSSGDLKLLEADNPYEECDFVAADIKKRVMLGAKYSEFGIIARSLSSYENILAVSFDKAKVPLFISSRTDIGTYEVIKLIYSAFAIIGGAYQRRDVISYSKCSLSGVADELADEFELYTEKWQISGKRFCDTDMWNMNPSGYTDRRSETDEEKLLTVDKARHAILDPVMALEDSLTDAKTVKDYTVALVKFLTSLNMEKRLLEKSKEAELLLGSGAGSDLLRLWQLICDSLDSLCFILGDLETNALTYQNLLKIAFSSTNIGRIPAYAEQVSAASADTARMSGKKYIYIIGANAGEFPAVSDDGAYFTKNDKRILAEIGLPIEEDSDIQSARELYLFTRAISFASLNAVISYHSSDTSFKPSPPSEAIARIKEISGGAILPLKLSFLPLSERAYSPEYALEHLDEAEDKAPFKAALSKTKFKDRLDISEKNIQNSKLLLSKDALSLLYGDKINMSQSKLEKYVKCPFSYFCQYDLRLNAEERVEFDSKNIGNFMHAVLENFFRALKEEGKKIASTDEEYRLSLISRVAENYISSCFEGIPKTSARIKNTLDKMCRAAKPIIDSLCDEFSSCSYEPVFFELDIDKKSGSLEPVVFNTDTGKEVYLSGKIDRVDVYNTDERSYIRVIDYKTGKKIFSPSDIEAGLNLQMFLYLKSIVETSDPEFKKKLGANENARLIPAGVIYVKTDISEPSIAHNDEALATDAVKKNQTRIGMLLDDEESISAMNRDFLPISYKKDGTLDSHSQNKVYTDEGWDNINETLEKVVCDISSKMTSGEIPALPFTAGSEKSPCTYCDFKPICRKAKL